VLAQVAPIAASATAVQPFGFSGPARLGRLRHLDARAWLLRGNGAAAAALTNEFLPGQGA